MGHFGCIGRTKQERKNKLAQTAVDGEVLGRCSHYEVHPMWMTFLLGLLRRYMKHHCLHTTIFALSRQECQDNGRMRNALWCASVQEENCGR